MTEDPCLSGGCGCCATSFSTDKECPECGRRLRVAGNPQRLQYRLMCVDCGYQSHQLSMEEIRDIVD